MSTRLSINYLLTLKRRGKQNNLDRFWQRKFFFFSNALTLQLTRLLQNSIKPLFSAVTINHRCWSKRGLIVLFSVFYHLIHGPQRLTGGFKKKIIYHFILDYSDKDTQLGINHSGDSDCVFLEKKQKRPDTHRRKKEA